MFYGEFEHHLDRKSRLILPAKIRETAKNNYVEKFFLTRGLDKCLFMLPEEEWKNQERKFKSMPFTKQEVRSFNRLFFSGAQEVIFDKQGRVHIPQYLKEFAGIKKDVVVIGVADRIEIWDKETWRDFYSNSKDAFEEIAQNLVDNGE